MVWYVVMKSSRQFLAELNEQSLMDLLLANANLAEDHCDSTGIEDPVPALTYDLHQGYQGVTRFIFELADLMVDQMSINTTDEAREWFRTGVQGGGIILLHTLRLEAERREIEAAGLTPDHDNG